MSVRQIFTILFGLVIMTGLLAACQPTQPEPPPPPPLMSQIGVDPGGEADFIGRVSRAWRSLEIHRNDEMGGSFLGNEFQWSFDLTVGEEVRVLPVLVDPDPAPVPIPTAEPAPTREVDPDPQPPEPPAELFTMLTMLDPCCEWADEKYLVVVTVEEGEIRFRESRNNILYIYTIPEIYDAVGLVKVVTGVRRELNGTATHFMYVDWVGTNSQDHTVCLDTGSLFGRKSNWGDEFCPTYPVTVGG